MDAFVLTKNSTNGDVSKYVFSARTVEEGKEVVRSLTEQVVKLDPTKYPDSAETDAISVLATLGTVHSMLHNAEAIGDIDHAESARLHEIYFPGKPYATNAQMDAEDAAASGQMQ